MPTQRPGSSCGAPRQPASSRPRPSRRPDGSGKLRRVMQTPDLVLLERLREVLANQPVTESERRLATLTDDPDSSLTEIAAELHRVDGLRPRLEEARALLAELETRARELRTSWLLRQADPLSR